MGGTLIFLGCFLWFAIAFNGGIGEIIVNYSAFASGLFMVIAGIFTIVNGAAIYIRTFTILALIGYGAVIWQRFNFDFDTDWVGFAFDGVYVNLPVCCDRT